MAEELTRRYSDHIEPASDHDLLIKINTKISFICKELKETKDTLKDHIGVMRETLEHRREICDTKLKSKVETSMFWRLIGILVVVLGVLFATTMTNSVAVSNNTTVIKYNSAQLLKNIEILKKVERILP
jgi:hypothetical protein